MPDNTLIILHDAVPPDAPPDQHDTLVQAAAVAASLRRFGFRPQRLAFDPNLEALAQQLAKLRPAGVFNLVEPVNGNDATAHMAPAWLDALGIAYTGASAVSMLVTSDKRYAKRLMRSAGIAAPEDFNGTAAAGKGERWIVKAVQMDASIGLDQASVVAAEQVAARLAVSQQLYGGHWFAERYIEGREFNLALLQVGSKVRVLPAAEIVFNGYQAGRARIVDYRAKWQPESFEYLNTLRVFPSREADAELLDRMAGMALKCWRLFDCRGYARVDFRVDGQGKPWVLELNANPCLAPDAGFAAALEQAGLTLDGAIRAIVETAGIRVRPV
jgi:D-alanine-D-alanine ligase